jgi:hypothetical protein
MVHVLYWMMTYEIRIGAIIRGVGMQLLHNICFSNSLLNCSSRYWFRRRHCPRTCPTTMVPFVHLVVLGKEQMRPFFPIALTSSCR